MAPKNKNLSAKELTALEDQLGIEQNLTNKYNFYAQNCQDANLKKKIEDVAKKHQEHFDALTPYLEN